MADKIALLLTIIGAINWGLIGIFQFDLVAYIFGGQAALLSRVIYTLVGAAGDPYREIRTFTLQVEGKEPMDVAYVDSSEEYFGQPFARLFAGQKIPVAWIEGVGHREEYHGIDVEGKLAVVRRGEISFVEKTKNAAERRCFAV